MSLTVMPLFFLATLADAGYYRGFVCSPDTHHASAVNGADILMYSDFRSQHSQNPLLSPKVDLDALHVLREHVKTLVQTFLHLGHTSRGISPFVPTRRLSPLAATLGVTTAVAAIGLVLFVLLRRRC